MNGLKRIARNTFVVFLSRVIEVGSGFIIMMVLCRYLSPGPFGEYAFITAVVLAFQPLINLELNTILIRDMSRDPENIDWLLGTGLILKLLLIFGFIIGICLIGSMLAVHATLKIALGIAAFSEVFQQIYWVFNTVFFARERMEYETWCSLIYRIITVGGIAVLGLTGEAYSESLIGVVAVFGILAAGNFFRAVISTGIVLRKFGVRIVWNGWLRMRGLLNQSWLIGIATFFTGLSFRVDVYVLKVIHGPEQISMFHVPHMLVLQTQIFAVALVTALFPTFSRLGGKGIPGEQFRIARIVSVRILTIVGLLLAAGMALFSEIIVLVIGGDEFLASARSLRILSWCIPVLFLNYLSTNLLTSLKRQNVLIIGAAFSLLVNLILDLLLIPGFKAEGAAWATLIAYSLQLVIALVFLRLREGRSLELTSSILLPFALTLTIVSICLFAGGSGVGIYPVRAISIGMLVILLFVMQPAKVRESIRGIIRGRLPRSGF
ncbi:flippase [bacterium]|nr:flippase [candidate division CSSED10-310 bacterium]